MPHLKEWLDTVPLSRAQSIQHIVSPANNKNAIGWGSGRDSCKTGLGSIFIQFLAWHRIQRRALAISASAGCGIARQPFMTCMNWVSGIKAAAYSDSFKHDLSA